MYGWMDVRRQSPPYVCCMLVKKAKKYQKCNVNFVFFLLLVEKEKYFSETCQGRFFGPHTTSIVVLNV